MTTEELNSMGKSLFDGIDSAKDMLLAFYEDELLDDFIDNIDNVSEENLERLCSGFEVELEAYELVEMQLDFLADT